MQTSHQNQERLDKILDFMCRIDHTTPTMQAALMMEVLLETIDPTIDKKEIFILTSPIIKMLHERDVKTVSYAELMIKKGMSLHEFYSETVLECLHVFMSDFQDTLEHEIKKAVATSMSNVAQSKDEFDFIEELLQP